MRSNDQEPVTEAASSLAAARHDQLWVGTPAQGVLRIDAERVQIARAMQVELKKQLARKLAGIAAS